MYQYPYGNAQQLNLDWILNKILERTDGSNIPISSDDVTNESSVTGTTVSDALDNLNDAFEELTPLNNYFYYYIDGVNGDDSNDGISTATPLKTLDAALEKHYEKDIRIRFLTSGTYSTNAQYFAGMALHLINYTQEYGGTRTAVTVYFTANHSVQFYNCYTHFEYLTLDWATDLYFDGGFSYHINSVVFAKPTKYNGMFLIADSITYNKVAIQECVAKIHDVTLTTTDANDHSIYLRDSKTIIYGSVLAQAYVTSDRGKAIIFTVRGELTYATTVAASAPATGRTYGLLTQQTNLYATTTRLNRLANTTLQGNNIQNNYPCVVYTGTNMLDLVNAFNAKQDTLTFDAAPTDNSSNPVTSDGIYGALATKQDTLTFDAAPTDNSSNPVTSDGIYDALATKQDTLTFDAAPTDSSINPVTSGGVFTALTQKLNIYECGRVNSSNPMTITFSDATRGFIVIFGGATRQAMYLLNCNAGAAPVTNEILASVDNNFTLTPSTYDGNGTLLIEAAAANNCTVFLMLFTDPSYITV